LHSKLKEIPGEEEEERKLVSKLRFYIRIFSQWNTFMDVFLILENRG